MASRTLFSLAFTLVVLTQVFVLAVPQIDPKLLKKAQTPAGRLVRSTANIFVTMKEGTGEVIQEISSQFAHSRGVHETKAHALFAGLREHAEKSQESLMSVLKTSRLSEENIKSFWITNQIYLRDADLSILDVLAARDDVASVDEEIIVQLDEPGEPEPIADSNVMVTDWNLNIIRAPDVWAKGVDGTGVVVGNIDTGARGTHETLRDGFMDDGYGWLDPYTATKTPTDDHGHGTLTLALTAGRKDIGVAPGARWRACKGLNNLGQGLQSVLVQCGQFMLCPTRNDGSSPDCSKAPAVINNSWNSMDAGATFFVGVIEAWQAAGIIPVFSNGNYGTACATVGSQASFNVIAVGATNSQDRLAYFSSVGPGYLDVIKPDIVAPGEAVKSAFNSGDTAYAASSGTSLAAPEVAGLIALLLQVNPELKYDAVKQILEVTAEQAGLGTTGVSCGGLRDSEYPNNHFGHGRVKAWEAYECVANGNSCLGSEYGEPCGTCKEGFACLDGRCRCRDVFGQVFDSDLGQCVSLIGASCAGGNSSCVDTAYCDNAGRCRCDSDGGFVASQNRGRCYEALKYGQECNANQCDFNKGLTCAGESGRCVCVDSGLEFRESDGACVAASGSKCGNVPARDLCLPPPDGASSGACEFYRVGCGGGAKCREDDAGAGGRVCSAE